MLFKDLKSIINEADEEVTAVEDETSVEDVPNKPQQAIDDVKDASDGVGAEAYKISNKIARTLDTDLTEYYNIEKIQASNNRITITADISKMKNGQVTSKLTGDAISSETLLNTIQQIIIADLGKDVDLFKLDGPKEAAPGVLLITVMSV
jgi:hypothetical protein